MNNTVNETYKVLPTHDNNFCRLFELPENFPTADCFSGGHQVPFMMVDWFNPIPYEDILNNTIHPWSEYKELLINFLKDKLYIQKGKKYILITDFNKSLIFEG